MMFSIAKLYEWFPVPLPNIPLPDHRYEGRIDGVDRPVASVVFKKDIAVSNQCQVIVKYPEFRDRNERSHAAITVKSTYHVLDEQHLPERILVNGKDVLGDEVRTHCGVKIALPPEPWIALSFRWNEAGAKHRADVRAYIALPIK